MSFLIRFALGVGAVYAMVPAAPETPAPSLALARPAASLAGHCLDEPGTCAVLAGAAYRGFAAAREDDAPASAGTLRPTDRLPAWHAPRGTPAR